MIQLLLCTASSLPIAPEFPKVGYSVPCILAVRTAVWRMRHTFCTAAQARLTRNNVNPVPNANFRQASHATHTTNGAQHSKPCQRLNFLSSRRKTHIVAARTESTEMPMGKAVPDFEVGLACALQLSRCN